MCSSFVRASFALAASASLLGALAGCGAGSSVSTPVSQSLSVTGGSVFGGQQPVTGAQIYFYAISKTGYKTAATSLISNASGTTLDAGSGARYVTTGAGGSFSVTGKLNACSDASDQLYALAIGGNPGMADGTNNTALQLMAALGPCGGVNSSTFININEVSTVAAAYALQPFMQSGRSVGTSSTNTAGLAHAAATITRLVSLSSGTALPSTATVTTPQTMLNTLANTLAPCVNSAGPGSSACVQLFAAATPPGGTTPGNTLDAILNIARFPDYAVHDRYVISAPQAPFQPSLTTEPNDFALGLSYTVPTGATGGALVQPGAVVVDADGSIWTGSCKSCVTAGATDYITKFDSNGAFVGNYTASGVHNVKGLAIDLSGNLWAASGASGTSPDQVVKLTSTGGLAAGFPVSNADFNNTQGIALDASSNAWITSTGNLGTGGSNLGSIVKLNASGTQVGSTFGVATTGIVAPVGVGIDNTGNVFVAAAGTNSILKLSSTGTVLSPFGGYTGSGLNQPVGVSIDAAGDVWTVDNGSNAVSEITNTGSTAGSSPYTGLGLYQAAQIAIDGGGNALIPNCRVGCPSSGSTGPDNLVRLSPAGQRTVGTFGFQSSGFNIPGFAAIDVAGAVWVTNNGNGSLTQVLGIAEPVKTPLVAASSTGTLGTRP